MQEFTYRRNKGVTKNANIEWRSIPANLCAARSWSHISSCSRHLIAVDSSTSHLLLAAASSASCSFFEGAGAANTDGGFSFGGGAEKTGIACLIRTGGTTPAGLACITRGGHAAGGGSGGAEKTGTDVLIVMGGAIPW